MSNEVPAERDKEVKGSKTEVLWAAGVFTGSHWSTPEEEFQLSGVRVGAPDYEWERL